jgi:PKD repeat protein
VFPATPLGATRWYADDPAAGPLGIPLVQGQTVEVAVRQDTLAISQSLTWTVTDLAGKSYSSDSITIREGDSLLLTATGAGTALWLDADGNGTNDMPSGAVPGDVLQWEYAAADAYTVTAKIDGASVGTLLVTVVDVDLHAPIACQIGYTRQKYVTVSPLEAAMEPGVLAFVPNDVSLLAVAGVEPAADGARLHITALARGTPVLQARVNGAAGAIISTVEVDEFTLDNTGAYIIHVRRDETGAGETHATYFTMDPLVPDPNIDLRLVMRSPGMTFANGTSTLAFTAADFVPRADGSGVYDYTIYVAPGCDFFCMDTYVEQHHSNPSYTVGHRIGDNGLQCMCRVTIPVPDVSAPSLVVGMELELVAAFEQCELNPENIMYGHCKVLGHAVGPAYRWVLTPGLRLAAGTLTSGTIKVMGQVQIGSRYQTARVNARCEGCTPSMGPDGFCAYSWKMVRVKAPPHAVISISPNPAQPNVAINFDGSASHDRDDDGRVVAWAWDFGDGSGSNLSYASHLYPPTNEAPTVSASAVPQSGTAALTVQFDADARDPNDHTYAVGLTVTDDDGLTGTASSSVTVSSPDGSIATYAWNFGDPASGGQNTSNVKNPTHTYETRDVEATATANPLAGAVPLAVQFTGEGRDLSAGPFTATVTVTDNTGLTASGSVTVTVQPRGLSYEWDFGDPASGAQNTSTAQNPTHTYGAQDSLQAQAHADYDVTFVGHPISFWATASDTGAGTHTATLTVRAGQDSATAQVQIDVSQLENLQYAWNFGDGSTATGPGVTHAYAAHGIYQATVRVTDGARTADASVTVRVLNIEIQELGFSGDHLISEWPAGTAIDSPDGSAPVWTRAGVAEPVCYTKNAAPTTFATFTVAPSVTTPITGVQIRAKVGTTIIGSAASLTISGTAINDSTNADGDVDGIAGGSAIPNSNAVRTLSQALIWECSLDGGATWCTVGASGPHQMHFVESAPLETPLYDLALEKACGYVAGNPNIQERICQGIDGEVSYNPAHNVTGHPLRVYADPLGAQCSNHADLMRCLVRSVGPDASVVYLWGGCLASTVDFFVYAGWWGPSFRVVLAAHDSAPANPHFTFHAVTECAGAYYDPSYGTTGMVALDETAPAGVPYREAGVRYTDEDIDGDGNLDVAEDIDGDGRLDVDEDTNGNGILDPGEDVDGDGRLDVDEDVDGDGRLDVDEDANGNGALDTAHANAAVRQTGAAFPPAYVHHVEWICPH